MYMEKTFFRALWRILLKIAGAEGVKAPVEFRVTDWSKDWRTDAQKEALARATEKAKARKEQ